VTKYTSSGLTKDFNESQANALLRNPKRIISPTKYTVSKTFENIVPMTLEGELRFQPF
jgi:hypothetical protein